MNIFWISIIAISCQILQIVLWGVFINKFWLRFMLIFFAVPALLGLWVWHLEPSIYFCPEMIVLNSAVFIFALIIGIGLIVFRRKPIYMVLPLSVSLIALSVLVSLDHTAVKNYYLQINCDTDKFMEAINKKSDGPWAEYFYHFPKNISSSWQDIRCFQGYIIDLGYLQLRFKAPSSEVIDLINHYSPKAKYTQMGFDYHYKHKRSPYQTYAFRNKSNSGFAPLPPHFKLLVLKVFSVAEAINDDEKNWPKYSHCGIAISEKNNEVIFWAKYP